MKLWLDDIRQSPKDYICCKSVNEAKKKIIEYGDQIELIDIDHDSGDYYNDGGDYIKLLDWLEETNRNYTIHIHSMNPVGIENMNRIIKRNNWKEI